MIVKGGSDSALLGLMDLVYKEESETALIAKLNDSSQ